MRAEVLCVCSDLSSRNPSKANGPNTDGNPSKIIWSSQIQLQFVQQRANDFLQYQALPAEKNILELSDSTRWQFKAYHR